MEPMDRRDFLARGVASLALLGLPGLGLFRGAARAVAPPAPFGRVVTWWWQPVRTEPSPEAEVMLWKRRDDVIVLHTAVVGEAPWPTNPVWYHTEGGYIHSGYVQPVEDAPEAEVIADVTEPGFWAEVCVPFAQARSRPTSSYVSYKLYYGTVYRVVRAVEEGDGAWWYQLRDGISWSPGPYVPSWSMRRIPPEQLAPIAPGQPGKWMMIDIADQRLTCLEGDEPVFSTRIASGVHGLGTPLGEFRILFQRHTSRMIGGQENDRYDLPGVPFPVYFTWSGVAIHGTYWHNDYGRRHSHGCVNVTSEAARWIFRWVEPHVPYGVHTHRSQPDEGTRVVVV